MVEFNQILISKFFGNLFDAQNYFFNSAPNLFFLKEIRKQEKNVLGGQTRPTRLSPASPPKPTTKKTLAQPEPSPPSLFFPSLLHPAVSHIRFQVPAPTAPHGTSPSSPPERCARRAPLLPAASGHDARSAATLAPPSPPPSPAGRGHPRLRRFPRPRWPLLRPAPSPPAAIVALLPGLHPAAPPAEARPPLTSTVFPADGGPRRLRASISPAPLIFSRRGRPCLLPRTPPPPHPAAPSIPSHRSSPARAKRLRPFLWPPPEQEHSRDPPPLSDERACPRSVRSAVPEFGCLREFVRASTPVGSSTLLAPFVDAPRVFEEFPARGVVPLRP